MASAVDICNRAMIILGAERMTAFTDNTREANDCSVIFNMISEEVQAYGPWPCNKIRATLVQNLTPPIFGFNYAYTLPPGCTRVLRVFEDKEGDITYQIENGQLLTDEPQISILYIGTQLDPNQFDVYLRQAIMWQIVSELCYKYTGQVQNAQALDQKAMKERDKLLEMASLQGSDDDLPSDTFVDIRVSGGDPEARGFNTLGTPEGPDG